MKSTLINFLSLFMMLCWSNSIIAQCDYPAGDITISSTGGSSSSLYTTDYVLVDDAGDIVEISNSPSFTGVTNGSYNVFAINYKNSTPPAPADFVAGEPWADIETWAALAASCADLSPALPIGVGTINDVLASDIDVCSDVTVDQTVTITDADPGVLYTIQPIGGGAALASATFGGSTAADFDMTITSANLPASTTSFEVVASIPGCTSLTLTDQIVITVTPEVVITTAPVASTVCEGETATFSVDADDALSYQWQQSTGGAFSEIAGATSESYTTNALTAGDDGTQYRVAITGNGSCPIVLSTAVAVTVTPAPTASVAAGSETICEGSTVSPDATAANGSILWTSLNGGTFSDATLEDPEYTPSAAEIAAGEATIRMTVSSAGCPDATVDVLITIDPAPTASVAVGSETICEGSTVSPDATAANGSILWTSLNGGTFSDATLEDPEYTPSAAEIAAGEATIRMTVSSAGCPDATVDVLITIDPAPTASVAVGSETICEGSTVSPDATAANGSILWTSLNGGTFSDATLEDPEYTPSAAEIAAGEATIRMTVSSAGCPDATVDVLITIDPAPTASVAVGSETICEGSTVSPDATAANGSILWTSLNGGTFSDATLEDPEYTPSAAEIAAGEATIRMTVSSAGCPDATVDVLITIDPAPTASVAVGSETICEGSTVSPDATAANGSILWTSLNGGTFSDATLEDPEYTPSAAEIAAGEATIRMTVSSAGCPDATVDVLITIDPAPTASVAVGSETICEGSTVSPDATAANGSILWTSLNGGTFSDATLEDPEYTPSAAEIAAGEATIRMTVSSAGCPDATVDVLITIDPAPTASVAVGSETICEGSTVSPDATAANGSILWTSLNGGTFSDATLEDPEYTPSAAEIAAGEATIRMTVSSAGCPDATVDVLITIDPAPTAEAGTIPTGTCDDAETYDIAALTTGASTSNGTAVWSVDAVDGTISGAIFTPTQAARDAGFATITLTVTGANGACLGETAIDTVDLTLTECCNAEAPTISKTP